MKAETPDEKKQGTNFDKLLQDNAIYGDLNKNIGRYGEASGQFILGYTGKEASDGTVQRVGLKHVHQYAGDSYTLKKSHAGFAAEIDEVSKTNADNIIANKEERLSRSNDVNRGNDMVFDVVYTDKNNKVILGKTDDAKGYQIKVKGRYKGDGKIAGGEATQKELVQSYKTVINELTNKDNERYLDAGVAVGSEQYDIFKQLSAEKYESLLESAQRHREKGNIDKAKEMEEAAKRAKKFNQKLRKLKDSSKEAMFSYRHPKLSTAKNVLKTSHKAGVEHSKHTGIAASVSSGIHGIVAVAKGEMDAEEALKAVAVNTVEGMGKAYIVGNTSTVIKGFMANNNSKALQTISKSNLPAKIFTVTKQLSGSVRRLMNGEIDEKGFLLEIGSQEAGMLAAGWGSALGAAGAAATSNSILLGVAGAAAGSTIALLIFSSLYEGAMQIYNEEKVSEEKRKFVESMAAEAKEQIRIQREGLETIIKQHYANREKVFQTSFQLLEEGFTGNNTDKFVDGLSKIAIEMGSCLQFKDFEEFDHFMQDDTLTLEF